VAARVLVVGGATVELGATLFSGGGGVEALLKDRMQFVRAVEYDPAIASVYRANYGNHIQVADVCDLDYADWPALGYLHASPVCKNASQAKTGGKESDTDIRTAQAVVRCLEATEPRVFTLENVRGYRKFDAYRLICRALDRLGYMWHAEVLNSADFGVPQTRQRLILRAVKDSLLPTLPEPEPWIGWYAAIEDLIPTLPPSTFAPWQLARLPEKVTGAFAVAQGTFGDNLVVAECTDPLFAVTANSNQAHVRAFLVDGYGNCSREPTVLAQNEPSMTVQAWHGRRPIQTPRAYLIGGGNTNTAIVDSKPRDEDDPAFTVTHARVRDRAWLSQGRVVKMTPRALARFQSLPNSFWLPEKTSLACTVIGNAVPSLMMRKIVVQLL
jgi:DNA-cytosine methyltransferase